jgi:hypothetical protein
MKYHHLERCFTYRMKRPMVSVVSGLRAVKVWDYGWLRHFHGRCSSSFRWRRARAAMPREDPTVLTTAPIASPPGGARVLFRDICQMGSLAGAAYLLHNNAGVLRQAQWEQKSHVEHKRKGLLD